MLGSEGNEGLSMKQKNQRDVFSFLSKDLVFDGKREHLLKEEDANKNFHEELQNHQGKIDVIILEDDPDMSNLLHKFFDQNNLISYVIKNAEEAILLLNEKRPFLVTVDLNLVGSSGHKFLSYIQNLKTEQKPWVAVVSGARKLEIDDALFEGGDFYFSKPVDFKELKVFLDKINAKNRIA